jgi:hypothetical protein
VSDADVVVDFSSPSLTIVSIIFSQKLFTSFSTRFLD